MPYGKGPNMMRKGKGEKMSMHKSAAPKKSGHPYNTHDYGKAGTGGYKGHGMKGGK